MLDREVTDEQRQMGKPENASEKLPSEYFMSNQSGTCFTGWTKKKLLNLIY